MKKYVDQVTEAYEDLFKKAQEHLENTISKISLSFSKIIESNNFGTEREEKWNNYLTTVNRSVDEIINKLTTSYLAMLSKAMEFDNYVLQINQMDRIVSHDSTTDFKGTKTLELSVDGEGYPTVTITYVKTNYVDSTDASGNPTRVLGSSTETSTQTIHVKDQGGIAEITTAMSTWS